MLFIAIQKPLQPRWLKGFFITELEGFEPSSAGVKVKL